MHFDIGAACAHARIWDEVLVVGRRSQSLGEIAARIPSSVAHCPLGAYRDTFSYLPNGRCLTGFQEIQRNFNETCHCQMGEEMRFRSILISAPSFTTQRLVLPPAEC